MPRIKGFNQYRIEGETTILYYTDRYNKVVMEGYIDTEDLQKLIELDLCWSAGWAKKTQSYYAKATERYTDENGKRKGKTYCLNRVITNAPKGTYVDHRGHNTLDDRKSNLRVTDNAKNSKNRNGKNKNNKSGYRNVFWDSTDERWLVTLQVDGKSKCLGRFKYNDLDKAGEFAEEMRHKYYKEFAGTNETNTYNNSVQLC